MYLIGAFVAGDLGSEIFTHMLVYPFLRCGCSGFALEVSFTEGINTRWKSRNSFRNYLFSSNKI